MGDTISAVQFFIMRRLIFPGVWSLYGAWGRHEVPRRAALLPVVLRLPGSTSNWRRSCCSHFIVYLRWFQLSLSSKSGVVALPWTAGRGAQEIVTIYDPMVNRSGVEPEDLVYPAGAIGLRFIPKGSGLLVAPRPGTCDHTVFAEAVPRTITSCTQLCPKRSSEAGGAICDLPASTPTMASPCKRKFTWIIWCTPGYSNSKNIFADCLTHFGCPPSPPRDCITRDPPV